MINRKYIITDQNGLHARPAAMFVEAMALVPGEVQIWANEKQANGKSILQILSLGVREGQEITVAYHSDSEEEIKDTELALLPISRLIKRQPLLPGTI